MRAANAPPTRSSPLFSLKVNPRGQDHCARCRGSVQALNTSVRGASNVRRMVSSRSALRLSRAFASMSLLLSLQLAKVLVEAIEAALPVVPVALGPFHNLAQRARLEPARARLCEAAAADESGALEHLQVFGDCRLAHRERPCQFHHTGLALGEPRQDGAASRVGERGERRVEVAGGGHL